MLHIIISGCSKKTAVMVVVVVVDDDPHIWCVVLATEKNYGDINKSAVEVQKKHRRDLKKCTSYN